MHIDINKIYVVGYSGGAYATFAMYMKSRHNINSFSAWCGISDLTAWYNQSLERKNKYSVDILRCTDSGDTLNVLKAKERSPLYWSTPVKKRKRSQLQIYAGIHDGYTGSVPISHSINFYNKVLHDLNVKDKSPYIPKDDEDVLIKSRNFPNVYAERKIDGRLIYYQKAYQKISITIFDGGHEILRDVVLDRLENTVQ